MHKILTEIKISSPPQKVWEILTNFDKYPKWNPFITSISGNQTIGSQLNVVIQPPGGNNMTFKPHVLQFDPCKQFRWKGKLLIKGIFDGEHFFKLTDNNDGTTTLIHGELFSGLLVGLMKKPLQKTKQGFEMMNQAIKDQCESV